MKILIPIDIIHVQDSFIIVGPSVGSNGTFWFVRYHDTLRANVVIQ